MWEKLSGNFKLVVTSISIGMTILGAIFTIYTWYMHVSYIVGDYPKLKDKISAIEAKMNGTDTTTVFINKQKFYQLQQKQVEDLNNLYMYKWPYSQWGNPNTNNNNNN
jgi:hypothetical protein